jgi:phosphate transport system substrate-binding protein
VYKANLDHIAKKRTGTIFGGKNEIGLTVDELVKREVK